MERRGSMPKWLRTLVLPLLVLSIVAAAGDDGGESGEGDGDGEPAAECSSDIRVGMALDIGGLGDKSFNDAANAGLQQAIADGLVCEDNVVTNEANSTGSDRDQNLQALADAG